ncbi:MAG TPA: hopanoid biosynthesis-associated protein HpnK [Rhizomicrobium sp.]|nr:hopanoid biosynthesis-associated protein HpnK [Rhizomicrobium sp.]
MKGLIVTADDFGIAREVNDAVEMAHRGGVLTAASLMVAAPDVDNAIKRAKTLPSLRVGLHIVLVDGEPALPAAQIPDLVDSTGRFHTNMARAGAAMFFKSSVRRQLRAEITAQFEAYRATGLPLDHVNAHKHFHLHPTILSTILQVGKQYGLKSIRVPYEPRDVLLKAEPSAQIPPAIVTAPWAMLARARVRGAGLFAPDAVFGLAWSGAMTHRRLAALIENLPDGISEIYCHPATQRGFAGSAPGYAYAEEFAALTAPDILRKTGTLGIIRGGFSDFQ